MEKIEKGILYIALHNKLLRAFGENKIITRKDFLGNITRHVIIPRGLRDFLLKDLEEKKLIKRIDRDNIKIMQCEIDLDNEPNKLYKIAGIKKDNGKINNTD